MKRPNIIVFMTDHQRFDTVPPFERAITPNLDKMFERGISFTNAYCTAPHCCPSRASFFSGQYPSYHGVWNNVNCGNRHSADLFEHIKLFPQYLSGSGYTNYFSGKWHVSALSTPKMRGFDYSFPDIKPDPTGDFTLNKRHWLQYEDKSKVNPVLNIYGTADENNRLGGQLLREGYPPYAIYGTKDNIFNDDSIIDNAVRYIDAAAQKDEPFFLYTSINAPHDPYIVPRKYLDMYDPDKIDLPESFYDEMKDKPNLYRRTRERFAQLSENEAKEAIRHYLAFCTYCDDKFGLVVEALKKSGKYEDTLIFYLSDHGDYLGEHGMFAKGLPCFDGAYHIPLVIGGGAVSAAKKECGALVSITDLFPTILEYAGVDHDPVAGLSLKPLIEEKAEKLREYLFTQSNGNELYGMQRSVFNKEYKLVFNGFDFDEFYDLRIDKNETVNRIDEAEYKDTIKKLYKELWKNAYKCNDNCITNYIMVTLAKYGPSLAFEEE